MKSTSLSDTSLIYILSENDFCKVKSYALSLKIGEDECNGVSVYICLLSSFLYFGNDSSKSIISFKSNNTSHSFYCIHPINQKILYM